ncbi:MAG: efflux transporter periplasmic adaptor subunit [Desulfobulbus propionicus]|nr:MAG: efflux transporter periplasmic adaptor subunit [Desulfobulbus propionicus]
MTNTFSHAIIPLLLLMLVPLPAPATATPPQQKEVKTTTVVKRQVPHLTEVVGTLEAVQRAVISAKVSGVISKIPVVLGSSVQEGSLLIQIKAAEIGARLKQAEAQLHQAQRNLDREKKLLQKHATTTETVQSMQDQYNLAKAAYTEVEAMYGYTSITAPFSGVVTLKNVHVGDLATPGHPLIRIEDNTRLQVRTAVPESLIRTLHPGDQLHVRVPAAGVNTLATVAEVAPSADPASRTAPVTLDLPYQKNLRSGQFARVVLPGTMQTGYYIPIQAVSSVGQMDRVFVVRDNRASLRLVRKGLQIDDQVEILSGLEPGEEVIVDSSHPLRDGQKVRTRP